MAVESKAIERCRDKDSFSPLSLRACLISWSQLSIIIICDIAFSGIMTFSLFQPVRKGLVTIVRLCMMARRLLRDAMLPRQRGTIVSLPNDVEKSYPSKA